MAEIRLTSDIDCSLEWNITDPDENISLQQDVGDLQPEYVFNTGTGVGNHNDAWYRDIIIPANTGTGINLQSLSNKYLGIDLSRSFSNVKVLAVENTSPSGTILIGSSGNTDSLDFLPTIFEIGYSGVYDVVSLVGYSITNTSKNLRLTNHNNFEIICKVLILGDL